MSLQKLVEYYVRKPLTGDEIKTLTGTFPIVYSELKNYKTLEDLLKKSGKPYAIVLYQTSSYSDGHYNAIGINFQGNPFTFDPYGYTEQHIKEYATYDEKLPDYIMPMLEDYARRKNKKVIINYTDFQSKSGNVADCGRHSGLACLFSQSMTFKEMEELYFTNADPWLKGDNVATILTLLSLKDIGRWYKEH
jgi:hypothetical protein